MCGSNMNKIEDIKQKEEILKGQDDSMKQGV